MPTPPVKRQAVAAKGFRKREASSSSDSSTEDFRGCRDTTSPDRDGTAQRATKSRKVHHQIILETPPMHRHVLEDYLECLWADSGVEFKFTRAFSDKADMDFFRVASSSRAETAVAKRVPVTRQVAPVSVAGSPATGAATVQVTASPSTDGTPQLGPKTLKRQR